MYNQKEIQLMKLMDTNKKCDALLLGDLHLREDTPMARTDDFLAAQWKKLEFIFDLQMEHNCPVLCSGDLFNTAKPSLELLSNVMKRMPYQFYTVFGNHDLPNHSLNEQEKCGVYALAVANKLTILDGTHFNQLPEKHFFNLEIKGKKILVWHVMTYTTELPFPGCEELKARSLLKKYPEYDLILTGDNHQNFTQTYEGRLLVNPGSMMRQKADQMDYKPAVWLWYADTNTVEPVYLPIEKGVVSREHIEEVEQRENRIDAFISKLITDGIYDYYDESGRLIKPADPQSKILTFEERLKIFLKKNDVDKKIEEIIYEMMED